MAAAAAALLVLAFQGAERPPFAGFVHVRVTAAMCCRLSKCSSCRQRPTVSPFIGATLKLVFRIGFGASTLVPVTLQTAHGREWLGSSGLFFVRRQAKTFRKGGCFCISSKTSNKLLLVWQGCLRNCALFPFAPLYIANGPPSTHDFTRCQCVRYTKSKSGNRAELTMPN